MGPTAFSTRGIGNVAREVSLHGLSRILEPVSAVLGAGPLIVAVTAWDPSPRLGAGSSSVATWALPHHYRVGSSR
jgi:hypothetical protein